MPAQRIGNPDDVSQARNPMRKERLSMETEERSLVAAGELVRHGQATLLRRLVQAWQIRAFGYYDMLGEVKYASQFYSRSLSQLKLFAAEIDEDGEVVPTENEKVKEAIDRIRDPGGGGRSGLMGDYGRLMFLVGEAYLFVSTNEHTGLEQWEMLSTDELRLMDGQYTRFRAPVLTATQFRPAPDDAFEPVESKNGEQSAVAYRIWRRHPRYSQLADSTMQGVLDLCEELVLLTQAVRARARSRLAGNGVLFLDDRITTQPAEPVPDEDPEEDITLAALTESMTAPIMNEGTASAVVPLLVRVRVPEGMKLSDLVYHLQIVDPTQLYPETGLRRECIERIAIGLDMPPEILLGVASANHWSGWLVDEQSWKAHLQPIADQLVQDLTSAYLAPYLKEQGMADWTKYCIGYDASAIINHPDRGKDAKDLHDRGVIGDEALRDATGFDETTAPNPKETNRWLGVKLRDSSIAIYGEPALRAGTELEPNEDTLITADGNGAGDGEDPNAVVKGPPKAKTEPPENPPKPSATASLNGHARFAQIHGAAQLGVLRAREAAGSRIRTTARRSDDASAKIDGVPAHLVAATLGKATVRSLGCPADSVLVAAARALVVDALRVFGVVDLAAASAIADAVERHAASTLYDATPAPLPATFGDYVAGVLQTAVG